MFRCIKNKSVRVCIVSLRRHVRGPGEIHKALIAVVGGARTGAVSLARGCEARLAGLLGGPGQSQRQTISGSSDGGL